MGNFLQGKRIAVTGGGGFLGRVVVDRLRARGCEDVYVVRKRDYDLVKGEDVARLYRDARPEVVIHLAAVVGGIGANRANPGLYFYENIMMGVQLIEGARLAGVERLGESLLACYERLVEMSLVGREELPLLAAWLEDLAAARAGA